MGFKNITLFFSILLVSVIKLNGQNQIKETLKDTMTYGEENTEKVIAFGNFIQTAVHENNPENFISKLNTDTFFERVLIDYPDINPEDNYVAGFIEGLNKSLTAFPIKIIDEVENGSYYDFINYRYDYESQTYYALFRLYSLESGLNYHDYRIQKSDDEIMFTDMYLYTSGEYFTNTLGRILSYSIPNPKQSNSDDVHESNSDSKALIEALLHNKSGRFVEAYNIMNSIETELSKEKFFLVFKVLVASQIDDVKYLKSLEELIETRPDDPTIALNKIDYYIFKEQYFEAIQVINQLQNETEDDFLNFMKGAVAFQDENYNLAFNMFSYTIEDFPGFFEAQAGYLNVLIMMEKYPDAIEYLDSLLAENYDKIALIDYLEEDDENGENILETFIKTDDFKAWKTKKD